MQYVFDYHPQVRGADVSKLLFLPEIECRVTLQPSRWTQANFEVQRLDVVAYWRTGMRGDGWQSDWCEVDPIDPLYARALSVLQEPAHAREIAARWASYVRDISSGDLADAIEKRFAS